MKNKVCKCMVQSIRRLFTGMHVRNFGTAVLAIFLIASCTDTDEANEHEPEAVIQSFIMDVDMLNEEQESVLENKTLPAIIKGKDGIECFEEATNAPEIVLLVKNGTDLSRVYLKVTLSEQSKTSTLSPPLTGELMDVSSLTQLTITSPSGTNKLTYKLTITEKQLEGVNFAQGKPATSSSDWSATYGAAKAVDGNATTRWSAGKLMTTDQWLQVDLERPTLIDRILVQEYNSRVTSFKVLVSDDAETWTQVYEGTNIVSEEDITFDPVTKRYLKLLILSASDVPSIFELGVFYAKSTVTLPELGSSMIFENKKGALTKTELDYFKAYAKKMALPTNNIGNKLVYGTNGLAAEGMAMVYEATGDKEILDLLIKHCDYMLYCRNDMPGGDGRTLWTGRVEPCWPNKDLGTAQEKYAASENGDILGHIYFCAYLILLTPELLDMPAPASDKLTNWGTTYRNRALKFIEMCDQTMEEYIAPHFVNSELKLCFPTTPQWQTIPEMPSGGGFPMNQQMMFLNGFQKAAECYDVLNTKANKKQLYLNIANTSINWQASDVSIQTVTNAGVSYECAQWQYSPSSTQPEDYGHAAFTMQEFYKLYESRLFPQVTPAFLQRFMNTLKYIMFDPATNTVSHKVNGTQDRLTAAKAGWVVLSVIDPDFYNYMVALGGSTQTDVGLMGHMLYTKSKLFGTSGFSPRPVNVARQ